MNIVHVITSLATGGAQSMMVKICSEWRQNPSCNVLVISLRRGGSYEKMLRDMGIEIVYVGDLPKMINTLREFRPDFFQGWMYHGNLCATVLKYTLANRAQLLWSIRQTLYSEQRDKILTKCVIKINAWLSKLPRKIIYNSHLSKSQHEKYGFNQLAGVVIANGFDIERCTEARVIRVSTRQKLGIGLDAKVVIHVARFHPMKDHSLFCKSLNHLMNEKKNVTALMVGRGISSQNKSITSGLSKLAEARTLLLGERMDVLELIAASDCLCLTSRWGEGFPNVLGEAIACGVPCVTTDVGDSRRVLGELGGTIDGFDEKEIAGTISKIFSKSASDTSELSQHCRDRAQRHYNIEKIATEYLALFTITGISENESA